VILFSPSKRAGMIEGARLGMALTYRLEPAILSRLKGHSVDVDPWEIGVAWAYDLDWSPLPVFQNYSAYTARLDALNAAEISSPSGPERILRENPSLVDPTHQSRSIDDRNPAWDPPEQARAILCHFVPLRTTSRWQVLGRIPNRCGRGRSAGTVHADSGEPVRIPEPAKGEVMFVRIHNAEVHGLERLRNLLYKAEFRIAVLDGSRNFRLIPGTASDGLLLRGPPSLAGRGPFAQIPQARTIALNGPDDDMRFEFFSMPVRRVGAARQ
jgi:hypothetical protein